MKNTKKKIKKTSNEKISKKSRHILSTIFAIFLAIIFPFVLLGMINLFDMILCGRAFTRLKDGINIWFTFWGSYAGAIITLVLSMVTIRLSRELGEDSKRDTLLQQAMGFHKFQVKSIKLYRMDDIICEKECLEKLLLPIYEIKDRQKIQQIQDIFQIEFEESFPPYFELEIKKVIWRDGDGVKSELKIIHKKIENNKNFLMYIWVTPSEAQETDINKFYYINYYEKDLMKPRKRTRDIIIQFECTNQMDPSPRKGNELRFELTIKLGNNDWYKESHINLEVLERKVKYIR